MDEKIRTLFIKRMGLILDKRKNDAVIAATQVRSEANKHGMLHSSRTALNIRKVYEETYDDICRNAWSQLHQIAVTIGVKLEDTSIKQLRHLFNEVMTPVAHKYLADLQSNRPNICSIGGDIVADAEAAFLRSREMVGTEIELFFANTANKLSLGCGSTHIENYNFSGPVGTVQQGDHSTATVTQNINTGELEALRSALESLLEKFRYDVRLTPLIKEAKAEAVKQQPQMGHIRGFLAGIKAFISSVKDGKELFEAVEKAALACGMDKLPPM